MDIIDGSGFWLAGLNRSTPPTPPVILAGGDYIPTFRPRRRAWWVGWISFGSWLGGGG